MMPWTRRRRLSDSDLDHALDASYRHAEFTLGSKSTASTQAALPHILHRGEQIRESEQPRIRRVRLPEVQDLLYAAVWLRCSPAGVIASALLALGLLVWAMVTFPFPVIAPEVIAGVGFVVPGALRYFLRRAEKASYQRELIRCLLAGKTPDRRERIRSQGLYSLAALVSARREARRGHAAGGTPPVTGWVGDD
jgi:hypothetical protein